MQLSITHNQVADETRALKTMLSQDVSGLIIEPSKSALPNPNMALYEKIKQMNIPVVFFNAKYPWSDFPCVAMDDTAAGRIVTEHLWSIGHRRISGIFALDDIQGHKPYSGYMEVLLKHNSPAAEQNVLWYSTNERKSFFSVSEDRILNLLNNSSAVVCYNDNIAVSLLSFCKKHGIRVPDDISIVGIDNAKLSRICEVPLTTATHPHQLLGETAAQKLMEAISDPGAYQKDELFIPELIVRKSTKPYKH
jgi:GntR family transcriptional regulator of arabinose operon